MAYLECANEGAGFLGTKVPECRQGVIESLNHYIVIGIVSVFAPVGVLEDFVCSRETEAYLLVNT